ncbi:tripartite tricarboxylate transporter TctB family protein [Palleronia rufa]|uniref:tripartite tricarboxylate transporter TctB family protein n=1 Tax=Palleronia rufa TaxID=1530186 RepID=UPI000567C5EC|nr:tripartite tricarboxylate transporter TctB family protein [Palleronia rufa]
MSDRIFGAVGLILAAFYAWATLQIQVSFLSDAVGPKTFPLAIAAILAISSLAILLRPDEGPDWPGIGRLAEIAAATVVMILYAQFLPEVGFVTATALASAYLSWRLGNTILMAIVAGISISVGIYVVFNLVLGLSLARGPFGF